ncbi:MAG: hypothetical protein LAO76_04525 [Acidobacteriia bacterium]|nr:hypothetical protein [Terriglobia bacterium]
MSELLYRNIVSQSGTLLIKNPGIALKIKELFLFWWNQTDASILRIWTRAERHMGAAT